MIINFYIKNIYFFTISLYQINKTKFVKSIILLKTMKKKQLDLISYLNIIEIIYNFLTSLNNTNKLYKEENEKLNINLNIELSSLLNSILEKNDKKNQNLNFKIRYYIIIFILKNNGYL